VNIITLSTLIYVENKAEVDFLLQYKNQIIPIEVKSDKNIKSRSLTLYQQKYKPFIRLRYALRNLNYKDGLLNIPLFMAEYTPKLIALAGEVSQRHPH